MPPKDLQKQIEELTNRIEDLEGKFERAIDGEKQFGFKGLQERVQITETFVKRWETVETLVKWLIYASPIAAGFIWWAVRNQDAIEILFKK